jgi:uncharacterized protein
MQHRRNLDVCLPQNWIVIQCRGHVTTKRGQRYANEYCYVCRLSGGKLRELIEYGDTGLISQVLDPPPPA